MAVRTGLQPRRRRRSGVGDITRGNPFRDLARSEKRRESVDRSERLIKKIIKERTRKGDTPEMKKRLERAIRSGVSQGISGEGVEIDFKPRRRKKR